MAKPIFKYNTEQQHLRNCQLRINGLTVSINMGKPYQSELTRMKSAREEILSRISATDLAEMETHENRVLTVAEKAAEAKALAIAMSENRDKPSI
jgi:DNA mismatch repair protein MutH